MTPTLKPTRRSSRPRWRGYLRDVLVADNQPVKVGQLLAKIDDRDFVTAVQQARANVAAAQADVDNIHATIEQQQAVIAQARATVTIDKANLTFMEQDNDRYTTLADRGAGSVQNGPAGHLETQHRTRDGGTRRGGADGRRKTKRHVAGPTCQGRCGISADRALQQQAALNLGYTDIVAPVDGVIGNRSLRVGQFVQAGTQLMAVVPLDAVYVIANFKETQLTDVRESQPVEVEVDTFPDARSRATSTASRPPAARSSPCCRPTTPPEISPRSCSASRSRSCWIRRPVRRPAAGRHVGHPNRRHQANRLWRRQTDRPSRRGGEGRSSGREITSCRQPGHQFAEIAFRRRARVCGPGSSVVAGLIGAFMAVLNIQITNASLLNIEGGIGTGVDNGAWISTAYLIGEIIVIPLTDYLSRVFSFRRSILSLMQHCFWSFRSPAPSPRTSSR